MIRMTPRRQLILDALTEVGCVCFPLDIRKHLKPQGHDICGMSIKRTLDELAKGGCVWSERID